MYALVIVTGLLGWAGQPRRPGGRGARAALASLAAGGGRVTPATRRLLELAVEIAVPIVLLALIWAYTARATPSLPPLPRHLPGFADTWLFERAARTCGRACGGWRSATRSPSRSGSRPAPRSAPRARCGARPPDRRVPARHPAAGLDPVRDRRDRRRRQHEGVRHRLRLSLAHAAEHHRRHQRHRPDAQGHRARCTGSPAATGSCASRCPPPARRSSRDAAVAVDRADPDGDQ